MKRSRYSQENEDVNGNKKARGSAPKKMKEESIASLMRLAAQSSSNEAGALYEQAGNLAESLEDQVGARRAFLELG